MSINNPPSMPSTPLQNRRGRQSWMSDSALSVASTAFYRPSKDDLLKDGAVNLKDDEVRLVTVNPETESSGVVSACSDGVSITCCCCGVSVTSFTNSSSCCTAPRTSVRTMIEEILIEATRCDTPKDAQEGIMALTSAQLADLRLVFGLYAHMPTREIKGKPFSLDKMQLSDWDRMWRDLRPVSWLRIIPIPHLSSIFDDWFVDSEEAEATFPEFVALLAQVACRLRCAAHAACAAHAV